MSDKPRLYEWLSSETPVEDLNIELSNVEAEIKDVNYDNEIAGYYLSLLRSAIQDANLNLKLFVLFQFMLLNPSYAEYVLTGCSATVQSEFMKSLEEKELYFAHGLTLEGNKFTVKDFPKQKSDRTVVGFIGSMRRLALAWI